MTPSRHPRNPRSMSTDLDAAEAFYGDVLGPRDDHAGRGPARLLPLRRRACCCCSTPRRPTCRRRPMPGCRCRRMAHAGRAICALRATRRGDRRAGRRGLKRSGIAIEADFEWPNGGRSIYFRDPVRQFARIRRAAHLGTLMRKLDSQDDRRRQPQCRQAARNRRPDRRRSASRRSRRRNSACRSRTRPARPSRKTPTSRRSPRRWPPACRRCRMIPACASMRSTAQPGVYTANWAETPDGTRDFSMAMQKVEDALAARRARSSRTSAPARFVAVICLAWPDGHAEYFRGEVEGHAGLAAARRRRVSATIRCSCRTATTRPSAR